MRPFLRHVHTVSRLPSEIVLLFFSAVVIIALLVFLRVERPK